MRYHTTLFLVFVFCLTLSSSIISQEKYDILIKGGTVIDGSGASSFKSDLLIKDGIIDKIGDIDASKIDVSKIIDAEGKIVSPGFIDSHAHGNPVKTPHFKNFSAMGVTTIILGQDGESASDISVWMKEVEEAKPAINIATLVGHGTMRDKSGIKIDPNPTNMDLQKMAMFIGEGIDAGAFGLSTGLEYQPGSFSKLNEIIAIATPVEEKDGIIHSHIRNEDDEVISNSIEELITQGEKGNSPVQISHIKVTYGHGKKRAEEVLAQMQNGRERGVSITADIYPYTASYTGIAIVFPSWAKPPYKYEDVVRTRRDELAEYLRNRINLRNGPESTLFGTAPWAGKTLKEVATELNKEFEDVLIDDIGPKGASAAYFVMDQELQDRLFIDPSVMVCSDGSPTMRHPRGYGSFAKVIRYYVNEQKSLSLESAIHKMTGLPASTIGFIPQKRGLLKEGYAADILVFNPDKVVDTATFENPHQLAKGFHWVIVNGNLIIENGEFTNIKAGIMLKKK